LETEAKDRLGVTGAGAIVQELGEQFLKSLDKTQVGAAASKLFAASVGEIVMLLSRSPAYKYHSLADIEWMVLPAAALGQFYVVEAAHKEHGFRAPIAVVTWAVVSDEVDRRLADQAGGRLRLHPDEWKSGETAWIIDAAGSGEGIAAALRRLLAGPLKQRSVKAIMRDSDGVARVKTLDPEANPTTAAVDVQ
jgi:hemolysin-activating ACP:hemolysin acyltransferase